MASLLRKIVKNDAMLNDPVEIYNWRVFVLASCVSLGPGSQIQAPGFRFPAPGCGFGLLTIFIKQQACFGAMSFGWDSSVIGGVVVMDPFMR